MPDGLVQLCLPARWPGSSIGDMTAGLRQVQQIYLLAQPHNYKCTCNSNRNACWSSAIVFDVPSGRVQLSQTCCFREKCKDMGTATGLIVS